MEGGGKCACGRGQGAWPATRASSRQLHVRVGRVVELGLARSTAVAAWSIESSRGWCGCAEPSSATVAMVMTSCMAASSDAWPAVDVHLDDETADVISTWIP